jgi:hypothetical protein
MTWADIREYEPQDDDAAMIAEAVEAYEQKRWPDGKAPGGKG